MNPDDVIRGCEKRIVSIKSSREKKKIDLIDERRGSCLGRFFRFVYRRDLTDDELIGNDGDVTVFSSHDVINCLYGHQEDVCKDLLKIAKVAKEQGNDVVVSARDWSYV
jgi:hypothetical protein